MEYLFVYTPAVARYPSFNFYRATQGTLHEWGASVCSCKCGVLEYCASENVTPEMGPEALDSPLPHIPHINNL